MAASIDGVLEETLQKRINSCKLLVVGAGGIGCELIKNLVLTGFHNVELVSPRVAKANHSSTMPLCFGRCKHRRGDGVAEIQ